MTRDAVTVRVPASTSNLGSGFDTLGLALQWYNTVRVERIAGKGIVLLAPQPEASRLFTLVSEAVEVFHKHTRKRAFGVRISLRGDVPPERGLGYSATIRVGTLAALNHLAPANLSREQLLELAVNLEGHPDNASPAVFGGFTASGRVEGGLRCLHFSVEKSLSLVTLVPGFGINTDESRKLLPVAYPVDDAAHALNRAALITAAFAAGRFDSLKGLFDDRFHQPFRRTLLPSLGRVIAAGEKAGAVGGFLSGSGSSIICLALRNPERVATAMRRQLPGGRTFILAPDNLGFSLLPAEP